jgi:glycosyltransferase involved in cell wall biosynthesis
VTAPASTAGRGRAAPGISSPGFSPLLVMDAELAGPLPAVAGTGQPRRAWVLVRLHSEPVGVDVIPVGPAGLTPGQLGALLWPAVREPVTARFGAAGLAAPGGLTGAGLSADPAAWPFLQRRAAALDAAPLISAVVCTRGRPARLRTCLRALSKQEYPAFEVVVVDNAAADDVVRDLVGAGQGDPGQGGPPLRYVAEPRPGLSWARNAGIAAARGEIIAFLDDDEEPDRHWLAGLATGFARGDDIGCVSGLVVPARLDTPAQELFERLGGHCKGRGCSPAVFSGRGPQSPLYPLPPFGVGANMAFRRAALARIGGFDNALGAGTPTCAGEDTLALTLLLLSGYRVAYEPAALMRHDHREDLGGLRRQLHGYGIGLTAYYTALLRHRPAALAGLLRLIPAAAGYLRDGTGQASPGPAAAPVLPRGFRRQRWWMLTGPAAYLRSLARQSLAARRVHRC